ncbi:hypothetical protein NDN08_004788 [Rhodosorus marinus]|uniref:Opine dehydrogenase domain-containing protein n=1 Tax=Rhodosorus marinus TaxID=101924 RepID=A0AAV8URC3_9RHOD|nr:hypothetical protein NDN08_004788 [Rhodosorus marinus]
MVNTKKKISWQTAKITGLPDDCEIDLETVAVTICGGGNGAHAGAAMFCHQGCKTSMYLSLKKEAAKMKQGIEQGGIKCEQLILDEHIQYQGAPEVSSDPSIVRESDVIIILAPGFAHESILREIKPFLKDGALVGALPAHGGFDLVARHVLAERIEDVTVFGTVSLPWAARIASYGLRVEILGTKEELPMSCHPRVPRVPIVELFNSMFIGTTFPMGNDFLEITLWPANNIIHPGILYGQWKNWEGTPLAEKPLFYVGLDDFAASKLQGMSDEIQQVKIAVEKELGLTLAVPELSGFMLQSYGREIGDKSSLKRIFQTNPGYQGLTHPMRQTGEGKYVPDFSNRYLTEDLPHGLAVLRGIAGLVNVPTPCMDEVLSWGQNACGQKYLDNGTMTGKDVSHSGVPQRFGYHQVSDLIF